MKKGKVFKRCDSCNLWALSQAQDELRSAMAMASL